MVAAILFFVVHVMNEPRDVDASRVLTNPFCDKESVMAVYRVSEKFAVANKTKTGKLATRIYAKYKCGECEQVFSMRCDREQRAKTCQECSRNRVAKSKTKHGFSRTPTYRSWLAMHERCKSNHVHYALYGGRGIKICERWSVFENFLHDMGNRPIGFSLDRVDVNGNYCPENCRWSSITTQNRNKNNSRKLEINGEVLSVTEWSEKPLANDRKYIFNALNRGVPPFEAVFGKSN